jgi:hypothetical protein
MPKKPTPATQESDDESDQMDTPPAAAPVFAPKTEKPAQEMTITKAEPRKSQKKERTPAQKEAFAKALAILKEKRKAIKDTEKEILEKATAAEREAIEKAKFEKAKNHKKKLPPVPSYVTMSDLEKFKLDLLSALPKAAAPAPAPEQKHEPIPVVAAKPEPVIKKQPVVAKTLTGHDLLDKLFFS